MKKLAALLAFALLFCAQSAFAQSTLKAVKDRGVLNCGANGSLAGFGLPDAQGQWTGLDVDICRAIAAAIFDDATKVKFVPLSAKDRFTALQSGEIDVLARNTTWTSSRDTSLGLNFTGVNYYDGQGFMIRKALKVNSALELSGASICVQQGTTTELNLADYFRANNMQLKTVTFATANEAVKAYEPAAATPIRPTPPASTPSGCGSPIRTTTSCCRRSSPRSRSRPPCGTATTSGSMSSSGCIFAMLNAEELNITTKNIDEMVKSANPEIKRFVGERRKFRRAAWADEGLGGAHRQARRQLRRSVRPQCRQELAAEDRARSQRACGPRRRAIRAADPLNATAGVRLAAGTM